jgi:hypothetical protein
VAKCDGDCEDLRPTLTRDTIEVPDDLREEIVGIQLLDRGFQQRSRPRQLRRACREVTHGTRAELRPPPLGVKLLLGANGVFEVFVDVNRQRTARMHGDTSSETSQALGAWTTVGGRVPCPN